MISGRRSIHSALISLAALPLLMIVTGEARQAPAAAGTPEYFESKVRPVLATNCYDCHTTERFAGLRVDSRESLLKGGRSGPAIVPGDPDHSLLIQAVRQTDKLKMPKGGHLTADEIGALEEWVRAGAPWPASAAVAAADKPSDAGAEKPADASTPAAANNSAEPKAPA